MAFYNPNDPSSVEKYSSAVSLSDMEIFIFPELMYSLVLANCMSPCLWNWKTKSWFAKAGKLSPYRRLLRLKQYVMDNFTFNLDLDTWGLTTKEQELARFRAFVDESILAQSNALFGYEGDKYYFDIDIRRHFGLDKYEGNTIPYWKTETVEAMEAFIHKPGYPSGAGECVSLSALYASALIVVAEIPLDDIFLLATPLHSQNFVVINDGVLTNNRRIVTKNMWYNGTELSDKARRAIQNERITVVAHHTGYIHTIFDNPTIEPAAYERFSQNLKSFLKTSITFEILANFLRQDSGVQKCFQIEHNCCGKPRYIECEKVYHYEHTSKNKVSDLTRNDLLHEIDEDEFYPEPIEHRMILNEIEAYFAKNSFPSDCQCTADELKKQLHHTCYKVDELVRNLIAFAKIDPKLPPTDKQWLLPQKLSMEGLKSHTDVINYLETLRDTNPVVDLAFMAYRDMTRSPWKPFLKAAFERNPACIAACTEVDLDTVFTKLAEMAPESIYASPTRMAQPDEVWNFCRGDGLEKALCFMNIARKNNGAENVKFFGDGKKIVVTIHSKEYGFTSEKNVPMPVIDDFKF